MSNEELVAVIQAGAPERMGELWEQVDGLVKWKAKQVMAALCGRCGVDFDDLYQSGYPALVAAVESYEPERGAFSTWFMYHLKTAFAEATGYRTKSGRNEPLNNSISLDTPLNDDSDSDTMMEVVADPNGQRPTQSVEEAIFHQQLHEALEASLSAIPEQSAEILRLRYYRGLTLAAVGEIRGTSLERYLMIDEERRERADQRFRDQVAKHQQEQLQREYEEIAQEAQAKVARMTAEEKRALLEKYGYA